MTIQTLKNDLKALFVWTLDKLAKLYIPCHQNSKFYLRFFYSVRTILWAFMAFYLLTFITSVLTVLSLSVLIGSLVAGALLITGGVVIGIISYLLGTFIAGGIIKVGMWLSLVEDRTLPNKGAHPIDRENQRAILEKIEEAFDELSDYDDANLATIEDFPDGVSISSELYTYLKKWHKELLDNKKSSSLITDEIVAYLFNLGSNTNNTKRILRQLIKSINSLTPPEVIARNLKSKYQITVEKTQKETAEGMPSFPIDVTKLVAAYSLGEEKPIDNAYTNKIRSTAYVYNFLHNKTLWKNRPPTGVREMQNNVTMNEPENDFKLMKEIAEKRNALGCFRTWRISTTDRFYKGILASDNLTELSHKLKRKTL